MPLRLPTPTRPKGTTAKRTTLKRETCTWCRRAIYRTDRLGTAYCSAMCQGRALRYAQELAREAPTGRACAPDDAPPAP